MYDRGVFCLWRTIPTVAQEELQMDKFRGVSDNLCQEWLLKQDSKRIRHTFDSEGNTPSDSLHQSHVDRIPKLHSSDTQKKTADVRRRNFSFGVAQLLLAFLDDVVLCTLFRILPHYVCALRTWPRRS